MATYVDNCTCGLVYIPHFGGHGETKPDTEPEAALHDWAPAFYRRDPTPSRLLSCFVILFRVARFGSIWSKTHFGKHLNGDRSVRWGGPTNGRRFWFLVSLPIWRWFFAEEIPALEGFQVPQQCCPEHFLLRMLAAMSSFVKTDSEYIFAFLGYCRVGPGGWMVLHRARGRGNTRTETGPDCVELWGGSG